MMCLLLKPKWLVAQKTQYGGAAFAEKMLENKEKMQSFRGPREKLHIFVHPLCTHSLQYTCIPISNREEARTR